MARSKQTSNKRDKEQKKILKRKEKNEKKEERKANSKKGLGLDDMMAYVDENGNLTSTPPDPLKKVELKLEDIQLGARDRSGPAFGDTTKGRVTFYNESKGYGFIKTNTDESIFFHVNGILEPIKEHDKVSFEISNGPKGPTAIQVTKIK